jgi:hypothetical protein
MIKSTLLFVLLATVVWSDNGPSAVFSGTEYSTLGVNPYQQYFSRPDLWPPVLYIDIGNQSTASGYVFLGQWGGVTPPFQPGPLIIDVILLPLSVIRLEHRGTCVGWCRQHLSNCDKLPRTDV